MSLLHDFLLLDEGKNRYEDYSSWLHSPRAVHLHDDVIRYFDDTLRWIPTINPMMHPMETGRGLFHWGVTIINRGGAAMAARVFQSWADLLECGPEQLVLTGGWCTEPDGHEHYAKLQLERDATVATLRTLAGWARRVEAGTHFILHLGV